MICKKQQIGNVLEDSIENLQSHIKVEVRNSEQWHNPMPCNKVEAA